MLLLIAVGLALRTYEGIRGPLGNAQSILTTLAHSPTELNSGAGRRHAEQSIARAEHEISGAQNQIAGSIGLKMLGVVPGLHTQKVGLEQLVSDLLSTTRSAARLLQSVDTLANDSHATEISLADLQAFGSVLSDARTELISADRSAGGLWGPLGADRQKFDREDGRAIRLVGQGEDLTRFAVPFLGGTGPRTYLVMGENNAEMRDQGATLSYALLNTANGVINVTNGGTVGNLDISVPAPGVSIPFGTQAVFGRLLPTQQWRSNNATADFEFSGRAMQAMFAEATGTHVNGVIGIDVVALQHLLALTGPVVVPGIPEPVTADNASYVLLNQLYAGLAPQSSQGSRREELAAVTSAAFHQLQVGKVDLVALARTFATEIGGRHLQVWDEDPHYEQTLREVGASGAVDTDDPTRTFHVAVENATATKLDYYVGVSISDTVYMSANGNATVDTSVRLINWAPAGRPASYQLGPDEINSHQPGEYVGRVLLWGPRGAAQAGSVPESGLVLSELDLRVLPGQSATAQFETTIPNALRGGKLSLDFVPQPRLTPESLNVQVVGARLQPGSTSRRQLTLTKTMFLTWEFSGNGR
jgi:hypothetical protein